MEIQRLAKKYFKIEEEIRQMLGSLPNTGCECDCGDCTTIDFIHYGEWKEIETFCLNCGGYVENV